MSQQFLTLGDEFSTPPVPWTQEDEDIFQRQMSNIYMQDDMRARVLAQMRKRTEQREIFLKTKVDAAAAAEKAREVVIDRLYKPSNYDLPQGTPSLFAAYGLGDEEGLDGWLTDAVKKVSKLQLPKVVRKIRLPKALTKMQLPKALRKIQPLKIIPKGVRTEIGALAKKAAFNMGSSYLRGLASPKAVALAQNHNALLGNVGWGQRTLDIIGKAAKAPFTLGSKAFSGIGSIMGSVSSGAAKGIAKVASLLSLPAGKTGEPGLMSYLVKDVAGKALMVVAQDKLGQMVGTKYPESQVQDLYDSLPGNQPVAVPQEAMEPQQAPAQTAGSPWPPEAGYSTAPASDTQSVPQEQATAEPSLKDLLAQGRAPEEAAASGEETPSAEGEVVENPREGPEEEAPPETLEASERVRRWNCQDAQSRGSLRGRIAGRGR